MHKQFGQIDWMKKKAVSEDAQTWISNKIKLLVGEGKDQEQAAAIAYSMAREKGYDVPEKKSSLTVSRKAELINVLAAFAMECPDCFKNLVLQVASGKDFIGTLKTAMTKDEAELKAKGMRDTNPGKDYVVSPVSEGSSEYTVIETKKASLEDQDALVAQEKALEEQLLKELQKPVVTEQK